MSLLPRPYTPFDATPFKQSVYVYTSNLYAFYESPVHHASKYPPACPTLYTYLHIVLARPHSLFGSFALSSGPRPPPFYSGGLLPCPF